MKHGPCCLTQYDPLAFDSHHSLITHHSLGCKVERDDVVFNLGRLALLVNAFSTNRIQDLRIGTQDKLHQPVRGSDEVVLRCLQSKGFNTGLQVMPALYPVINAALAAGADGRTRFYTFS